jgi:hypothetical protein
LVVVRKKPHAINQVAGMGRGGGMGNPVNVGIAVQADWENREFISNISLNVRRLFDFLLRFGQLLFHFPRGLPSHDLRLPLGFARICCRCLLISFGAELNCPCRSQIARHAGERRDLPCT